MTDTPWTPGPWRVQAKIDIWIMSGSLHVATIPRAADGDWSPHNARLIAAAPEYDELLGEAIDIFEGDLTGVEWKRAWRDFTHRAKALRAKARGDQ